MSESKFIVGITALAKYTGFHRDTLYPKVLSGEIKGVKRCSRWVFTIEDIDKWMTGGDKGVSRDSGKNSASARKGSN